VYGFVVNGNSFNIFITNCLTCAFNRYFIVASSQEAPVLTDSKELEITKSC
jgi:hypothetical protein